MVMQEVNLDPSIIINPALYFLDKSKSELTLAAETRKLTVGQNERAEKGLLKRFWKGRRRKNYGPVADGFSYEGIEILPNLINVFLNTDSEKRTKRLRLWSSQWYRLVDFSGVSYINIFVNGVQSGYESRPSACCKNRRGLFRKNRRRSSSGPAWKSRLWTSCSIFWTGQSSF